MLGVEMQTGVDSDRVNAGPVEVPRLALGVRADVQFGSVDEDGVTGAVVVTAPGGHPALYPAALVDLVERLGGAGVLVVRGGRVYPLTEWYLLHLGSHVGDVAERLAEVLHPEASQRGAPQPDAGAGR